MGKEKLGIIRYFDGTFAIIEVKGETWEYVCGPYLSHEEALPDLRNLQNDNRDNL